MKTEKLFELLALVGGVESDRWNMVMKLSKGIAKKEIEVTVKEWNDSFKEKHPEYYPMDLGDIKTWSTFEGSCVELKFLNWEKQLVCQAWIYDGEFMDGRRVQLRFTATLRLPLSFVRELSSSIQWAFDRYLDDAYENHLEAQKKLWIEKTRTEILKATD